MNEGLTPIDIAVTLGRIELGVMTLNEKVDKLTAKTESHDSTLTRHEVDLQVLKSKQGPKIHWLTILVGIVAVAGFSLALLDRLYR